jgi:hypothetical protein
MEKMLGTVEETMSRAIDGRGDPPPPAKEATERFRTELGRELKGAPDRQVHETYGGKSPT